MPAQPIVKSAILMTVLVLVSVLSWEFYLRGKGFENSYYDDSALWAHKRDMVYEPTDKSTVFIGSSRIKFDLDIDTWERITGDHAIQLACVGSNPIPVLIDLAADENFKGKVVVDVTEGLFFSSSAHSSGPDERIKYYKDRTPAQRAGFPINRLLESQFVFLDKEWLSLGAQLDKLPIKDRDSVFNFRGFPSDFGRVKFNRQEYMTDKFASDTALQNIVKNIWIGFGKMSKEKPLSGAKLDSVFTGIKTAVEKIKARGGQILFVRTPSSGGFLEEENKNYPREKYWDRLLAETNCPGIHFKDYPSIDHFICPENSHLSLSDAKVFTINFIPMLEEKGWKFPYKSKTVN